MKLLIFFPTTRLNPAPFACSITHIITLTILFVGGLEKEQYIINKILVSLSPWKVLNCVQIWLTSTKSEESRISSILAPFSLSFIHMHY